MTSPMAACIREALSDSPLAICFRAAFNAESSFTMSFHEVEVVAKEAFTRFCEDGLGVKLNPPSWVMSMGQAHDGASVWVLSPCGHFEFIGDGVRRDKTLCGFGAGMFACQTAKTLACQKFCRAGQNIPRI